jgi:protein SCO1/2
MSMNLSGIRKTLTVLTLFLGLGVVGFGVYAWKIVDRGNRPSLPVYGTVPAFSLIERNGRTVQLSDLQGMVWVVDFIFTSCPGPCPTMTSEMKRLQSQLEGKNGVRLVSVTVDPETDTPAVLSNYAREFGADPTRWLFLTGSSDAIQALATQGLHLFLQDGSTTASSPGQGTLIHSTRFVLIDRQARIRGYFDSVDRNTMKEIVRGIDQLLGERSS